MTPENKQFILETDNSALIDCTVQWMNLLDKDLQKNIVDRISSVVKEEGEEEVNDQEKSQRSQWYLQLRRSALRLRHRQIFQKSLRKLETFTKRGTSIFCRLSTERGNRREEKERYQC